MRLPRFLAVLAVAGALPGAALAGDVRLETRAGPGGPDGTVSSARRAPLAFNMVGIHWQGPGTVWFRTARRPGVWGPWRHARPEADDAPDRASAEGGPPSVWTVGSPWWTGKARYVQYRFAGRVDRVRAHFIASEPEAVEPTRVASVAGAAAVPAPPAIVLRAAWGADESIVRAAPSYAERLRFAVVHHTAGSNSYSKSQSAAIVRGIQRYHVKSNGWNDIGYNFLVDRYGQIFEGRGGGIDRNVVGAHAGGFNTGSSGVAVLGTYESTGITRAARRALVRLLAWRLDVGHVDPTSVVDAFSAGNERFSAGTKIRLRAVSGHRDTGYTSCPGTSLYGRLGRIATNARARGLPKIFDPAVVGRLGGPVRITARLSTSLPWTVTITDASGTEVAAGSGSGTTVDWTWDASAFPYGDYRYTVAAPDARPATYRVPGPPPLTIRRLRPRPATVTPNGDGVDETVRIRFRLNLAATATVSVLDASGRVVDRLAANRSFPAGRSRLTWDATAAGVPVPDGRYRVRVEASSPGQEARATRAMIVDRTLGHLELGPTPFSPNGDRRKETTAVHFRLEREAFVVARVFRGTRKLASVVVRRLPAGAHAFSWDGRNRYGVVPSGTYSLRVTAETALGVRVLDTPVTVDTVRPVATVLRARRRAARTVVRLHLSEDARVRLWYGTPRWWSQRTFAVFHRPAGRRRVAVREPAAQIRVVPFDLAGNKGRRVIAATRG